MTNEPSNEIIEISKAIQATAKTPNKAIGVVADTGNFLNKIFGELVQDSVGIVADKIKFYRLNNYLITTQAKRNLSSRSGIGGVLSAT